VLSINFAEHSLKCYTCLVTFVNDLVSAFLNGCINDFKIVFIFNGQITFFTYTRQIYFTIFLYEYTGSILIWYNVWINLKIAIYGLLFNIYYNNMNLLMKIIIQVVI